MNQYPKKYQGSAGWVQVANSDDVIVDRAILRSPDELVVDFVYDGRRYTVKLHRTGGNEFRGVYITRYGARDFEGSAYCRLFSSAEGLFLFGKWDKDGEMCHWWADLDSVESFADKL